MTNDLNCYDNTVPCSLFVTARLPDKESTLSWPFYLSVTHFYWDELNMSINMSCLIDVLRGPTAFDKRPPFEKVMGLWPLHENSNKNPGPCIVTNGSLYFAKISKSA